MAATESGLETAYPRGMKTYPASGEMANHMHPGEFLKQGYLEELDLSVADVAEALGISPQSLAAVVDGQAPVTPELALRLEAAFSQSAESWLNLQANHNRSALKTARGQVDVSEVERLYTPPSIPLE